MTNSPAIEPATPSVAIGAALPALRAPATSVYDLVILGAGPAGLAAAGEAAKHPGRLALAAPQVPGENRLDQARSLARAVIDSGWRDLAAQAAADAQRNVPSPSLFGHWIAHWQERLSEGSDVRELEGLRQGGFEILSGHAVFTGPDSVAIHGREVKFERALIATDVRPELPPIAGLEAADCVHAEAWTGWAALPGRVLVLGAGAMACELAQAMCRLGAAVHLIDPGLALLPQQSVDVEALVREQFLAEGIRLHLGWTCCGVEALSGAKLVLIQRGTEQRKLLIDQIVVAGCCAPDLELLALEAARVDYSRDGILIDERLRTSNRRIYAAGPVCALASAGHAPATMGRLAARNALGLNHDRIHPTLLPRVVHTDPQVAEVGTSPEAARDQGLEVDTYRVSCGGAEQGINGGLKLVSAWVNRRNGRLLGAAIVGRGAAWLADHISLVIAQETSLFELAQLARSGRLASEALRRLAAQSDAPQVQESPAVRQHWLRWPRSA